MKHPLKKHMHNHKLHKAKLYKLYKAKLQIYLFIVWFSYSHSRFKDSAR